MHCQRNSIPRPAYKRKPKNDSPVDHVVDTHRQLHCGDREAYVSMAIPTVGLGKANGTETCVQEWVGTAPSCNGECPAGWRQVRRSPGAVKISIYGDAWVPDPDGDPCDPSTVSKVVICANKFGSPCSFGGSKALCEKCGD